MRTEYDHRARWQPSHRGIRCFECYSVATPVSNECDPDRNPSNASSLPSNETRHHGAASHLTLARLSCDPTNPVSFLSGWDFFTGDDPTHGLVNYVDGTAAKKLAYVQSDDTVVIAVDDSDGVAVGGKRNSIRISTKKAYTRGLFVADIFAMPHGCGVWPAYWSLGSGKDWPNAGEIDIIGESRHPFVSLSQGRPLRVRFPGINIAAPVGYVRRFWLRAQPHIVPSSPPVP